MLHSTALTGWAYFTGAFGILALVGLPPPWAGGTATRVWQVLLDPSAILILGSAAFGLFAVGVDLAASRHDPIGLLIIALQGVVAILLSAVLLRDAIKRAGPWG